MNGGFGKLLRHANDILSQIFLVVFFVIMGAIPLNDSCVRRSNFRAPTGQA